MKQVHAIGGPTLHGLKKNEKKGQPKKLPLTATLGVEVCYGLELWVTVRFAVIGIVEADALCRTSAAGHQYGPAAGVLDSTLD